MHHKSTQSGLKSANTVNPYTGRDTCNIFKAYNKIKSSDSLDDPGSFNVRSTICLIPLKIKSSYYKILSTTPKLEDPDIRACYTLVSHGPTTHTYSLLPHAGPSSSDSIAVKPLVVYETTSKHLSHATVKDLSMLSDDSNDMREILGSQEHPSSIRISFINKSSYPNYAHLQLRVASNCVYRWKKMKFSRHSDNSIYMMHRQRENGEEWNVPVACLTEASISSPVDGSKLWAIEIDATRVNPIIALLSCFAGRESTVSTYMTSICSKKTIRPPKILSNIQFEDEYWHDSNTIDKQYDDEHASSALEVSRSKQLDEVSICNSTTNPDQTTKRPMLIKVFDRNAFKKKNFDIPEKVLNHLNVESRRIIRALRIKYGVADD